MTLDMHTILETKIVNKMARLINAILIFNIGIVLFALLAGSKTWLINAQVGFVTALVVVSASLWSYRQMIRNANYTQGDFKSDNIQDASHEQSVQEEEPKITMMQALRQNRAYISLYRLGGYLFLAVGFAILFQTKMLHIPSYFGGIFLAPLAIVVGLWQKNKKEEL